MESMRSRLKLEIDSKRYKQNLGTLKSLDSTEVCDFTQRCHCNKKNNALTEPQESVCFPELTLLLH